MTALESNALFAITFAVIFVPALVGLVILNLKS